MAGGAGGAGGVAASRWDAVPEEMRRQPRWVCWQRVERGGRATKMPVCAATGKMASSTDPGTWCSFAVAVASVGKWGTAGIGFVFGPDKAYTGLDLDHVLENGVLAPEYRWVVDAADTYTEVSPSGDGLHLYFRGSKPAGAERCRKGCVEMYDHDRFFTVTGVPFGAVRALAERPEIVERAYRAWIEPVADAAQGSLADAVGGVASNAAQVGCGVGAAGAGAATGGNGNGGGNDEFGTPADLTDDELMERMLGSRYGADIKALLAGDMAAQGGDHSAADLALCNHLAFWCGGDEARMDRFFRGSGLMRDKWDSRRGGATYGAQTIANAVRNAKNFYRPRRRGKRGVSRPVGGGGVAGAAVSSSAPAANTYACSTVSPQASQGGFSRQMPAFDPERPPSFSRWRIDAAGALRCVSDDGTSSRLVCGTPPWVAMDLVDCEDAAVRALVRVACPDGVRELAAERDSVLNANRIVGLLAPLGAAVSTANAKDLVRYLTDAENLFAHERPRCASTRHLGWAKGALGPFVPFDAGEVRFDPPADQLPKARPFMEPAGTLAEWVAGVGAVRAKSPAFRLVLAASFASPLVSLLNVQAFIVYLWGRSRSGKTPTLKAAGSVWGDPTEGADGYFRTFADTPKSIIRAAALLHDVPVIIDELQAKGAAGGGQAGKRMAVEDLLYNLSIGHERSALNSDRSMMSSGSWRSLTIATGEIPIVGDATQQGAANRTLELNAEPFSDPAEAQAMHRLVACQHGTAGRAYIAALRAYDKGFYDAWFRVVRERVGAVADGHPQADNIALLALADVLAEYFVFGGVPEWDACIDAGVALAKWAVAHSTGVEADTDIKAIQRVSELLAANTIHFDPACELDRLERWGVYEDRPCGYGRYWHVVSTRLARDLAENGFDKQKTLRRMADEGLLVLGRGRRGFGKQKKMPEGNRIYCNCIDGWELERFLMRVNGDLEDEDAGDGGGDAAGDAGGAVAGGGDGAGVGGASAAGAAATGGPGAGYTDYTGRLDV